MTSSCRCIVVPSTSCCESYIARVDEHARTIWAVETKSLVLDIEPERWWQRLCHHPPGSRSRRQLLRRFGPERLGRSPARAMVRQHAGRDASRRTRRTSLASRPNVKRVDGMHAAVGDREDPHVRCRLRRARRWAATICLSTPGSRSADSRCALSLFPDGDARHSTRQTVRLDDAHLDAPRVRSSPPFSP